MVEEVKQQESKKAAQRTRSVTEFSSEIVKLADSKAVKEPRIQTHISEFDRLLGGGLVKGQLSLLAGAPGIGKSTLMLQVAAELSKTLKVLYTNTKVIMPLGLHKRTNSLVHSRTCATVPAEEVNSGW